VVQTNPTAVGDQKRDIDWYRVSNRTVIAFGEARLELHGWYLEKTLFHPIFQLLDQKNKDGGAEARWVSEAPLAGRRNILTAGIAVTQGTTEEDRWLNFNGSRGPRTNKFDQLAENLELYAENQHYFLPRTAFVLGGQYSENRRENTDLFIPAGQGDESFDQRYSGFSPKIGVRHELSPAVQLFANYSGSYEPPSFGELVGGLQPNLVNAQKAKTFEVGSRGLLADLTWDIALYHARVEDELLQTLVFPAGNNPVPSPQTVNVPRTIHQGLELGTSGRFARSFEWRQNFFLNRFRFDGDPTFGDNTLPGLPKSLFKGELLYRAAYGLHFAVNVEYSPSRYPVDMANTLYADSYTVWGARVGQKIGSHWYWFLEGRNLADQKYAATTGVTRDQAGLDGAQFLPGDGRSFYAGLEFRL
jgi:iron complex outermembrane receptor protein